MRFSFAAGTCEECHNVEQTREMKGCRDLISSWASVREKKLKHQVRNKTKGPQSVLDIVSCNAGFSAKLSALKPSMQKWLIPHSQATANYTHMFWTCPSLNRCRNEIFFEMLSNAIGSEVVPTAVTVLFGVSAFIQSFPSPKGSISIHNSVS